MKGKVMSELVIMIATALISGLFATIVTILWQRKAELRDKKMKIFEVLMGYRYMISSEECVKALNAIDIVFYRNQNVRRAYAAFLDEVDKDPKTNPNINIADKHLKLLEEISKALKLKNIQWDTIKKYYYPTGLARKLEEEALLRKLQIESASDITKKQQEEKTILSNDELSQQLAIQMIPELIKNPEGFKNLIDLADQIK